MTEKEKPKPAPMKVASPEDKAWIPGIGEITVAELGERLKEAKVKRKFAKEELVKELLSELMNVEIEGLKGVKGVFTAGVFKDISASLKEKHERKVGVSRGYLMKEGYIDRTKVEGLPPLFFITPKGRELLGLPVETGAPAPKEEAPSAAEEALKAIAEEGEE